MLLLSFLVSCLGFGTRNIKKYEQGDTWKVNFEDGISYKLHYIEVNKKCFRLKITKNITRDKDFDFVLDAIRRIDYILIDNVEIITQNIGFVIPQSVYMIPLFKQEILLDFYFNDEAVGQRISTNGMIVYLNQTGSCGPRRFRNAYLII